MASKRAGKYSDGSFDTDGQDEIACPYCGVVYECSYEIAGSREDGETTCDDCGAAFTWFASYSVTYSTYKLPTPTEDAARE